jgi:hypothetical protein
LVRQEVAEPIYRDTLRQVSDESLESEARGWVWLCETRSDGPWAEDVWHQDCVREEFERRGRLDVFLRGERRILVQLGKAPKESTTPENPGSTVKIRVPALTQNPSLHDSDFALFRTRILPLPSPEFCRSMPRILPLAETQFCRGANRLDTTWNPKQHFTPVPKGGVR